MLSKYISLLWKCITLAFKVIIRCSKLLPSTCFFLNEGTVHWHCAGGAADIISTTRNLNFSLWHFQDFCPLADLTPVELSLRLCTSYLSCSKYDAQCPLCKLICKSGKTSAQFVRLDTWKLVERTPLFLAQSGDIISPKKICRNFWKGRNYSENNRKTFRTKSGKIYSFIVFLKIFTVQTFPIDSWKSVLRTLVNFFAESTRKFIIGFTFKRYCLVHFSLAGS